MGFAFALTIVNYFLLILLRVGLHFNVKEEPLSQRVCDNICAAAAPGLGYLLLVEGFAGAPEVDSLPSFMYRGSRDDYGKQCTAVLYSAKVTIFT